VPTWINFFCYWMLQLPLAWYLANQGGLGPNGVYLAICSAESVLAVVSAILFRRGAWKTNAHRNCRQVNGRKTIDAKLEETSRTHHYQRQNDHRRENRSADTDFC